MSGCVCMYMHMCSGGVWVERVMAGSREMSLRRGLRGEESFEAYLDLIPDRGVHFMAPGSIPPSGALFR